MKVNQSSIVNSTPSAGNAISEANSLGGTHVQSIQRYSDSYLQNYYWRESSSYNYLKEYSSIASNVQDLTNELRDTGLSAALTNFYTAVNALNSTPSDITARQNFVSQAENVCSVFNTTAESLQNIQKELVGDPSIAGSIQSSKVSSCVDEVNSLLDQIAEVNNDIIKTNSGTTTSTSLLDQRDSLVSKLTELIPVKITEHSNSTVDIGLGDYDLVKGINVTGYLQANSGSAVEPAVIRVVDPETNGEIAPNVNSSITGGTIGAILSACGPSTSTKFTISGVMKSLDAMASNFASTLNKIQTQKPGDVGSDGTTPLGIDKTSMKLTDVSGYAMFVSSESSNPTIDASNISVNGSIISDPYLVATARIDIAATPNYQDSIGNASNVDLITKARNTPTIDLSNQTLENYLTNMVTDVGNDTKSLSTSATNENLVLTQVKTNLQNATGVNLDEELVDLMKYQRAYQASARVFTTCSQLLEELVNLGK